MKKYNISHELVCSIRSLYNNASRAIFHNRSIGEWFKTSVGVRQGCLLFPMLFNVFLERIMTYALDGHVGTVSIGGRQLTNLRFADDIDGFSFSETEVRQLVCQTHLHHLFLVPKIVIIIICSHYMARTQPLDKLILNVL